MPTDAAALNDGAPLPFDPDALRAKYRAERDKRIRSEGNSQYRAPTGDFAHYVDDPYTAPFDRDPLADEVDAVVVGSGFGGLLAGARLRQAGLDRIRLIDKAGDVGGTWYWNRYPGIRCDVESYVYMPLLEEVGYIPTEKYASGPEILEHARALARKFDLYRDACFQTQVTCLEWDEADERWIVTTDRGDRIRSRYVLVAVGYLHRPKLPAIPGIETFTGHSFHSSRWDFEYTGGDSFGGMAKLHDKRVGLVGTGATAVQAVPHLAAACERLYVFQRTPTTVDVRANRPTDPEWVGSLTPGWQQRRMDNFHTLTSGGSADEDLVGDAWTDITAKLAVTLPKATTGEPVDPEVMKLQAELADFAKMEEIRRRVEHLVEDPRTAEVLKPYYRLFCKRPTFHDEYLPTFNRPNVTLVDTEGRGIDRIEGSKVFVGEDAYEVDCLIFASGFESEHFIPFTQRTGYDMIGRGGRKLSEWWADGARTFQGVLVNGFPNLFIMSKIQFGFHLNHTFMLNEQAKHIAYIIKTCRERGDTVVEASAEAEQEWVDTIVSVAVTSPEFLESCTPGLFNNEGRWNEVNVRNGSYGAGSLAFFDLIERWRAPGDLAGLETS